ncbi:MAG: PAAR domain-containing protein [Holophagales bacterium]|nr:PAAR domain-containing protein [Holophagales bacterium]MBK9967624.1 PAAR domain-containing protein [Holophagales bacterium]
MPPAARISDMHACPLLNPDESPHVGGPIVTGLPTVLIGYMPAARITDMAVCVGPPDVVVQGAPTVFIGSLLAARLGDQTTHGGVITSGCPTVLIGESGSGGFGGANTPCGDAASQAKEARVAMWKRQAAKDFGVKEENVSVALGADGRPVAMKIKADQVRVPPGLLDGTPPAAYPDRIAIKAKKVLVRKGIAEN